MITTIDQDDFDVEKGGQVEIIGWLYQYYNTEPHNYAVNITGGPVTKNEIPAATQLFTTDWVVRYMVDNSLGKYWLERHPDSNLKSKLPFLLPTTIETVDNSQKLEDIKFIDNAMGSGHILVYAFDTFMNMYLEEGYSSREAALLIVKHNLYGLEVDKRAFQLAYFALMMKVRQYNRRALREHKVELNIYVFEDTDTVPDAFYDELTNDAQNIKEVVELFENARELGSIIQIGKTYDWSALIQSVRDIQPDILDVFSIQESKKKVLRILNIARTMTTKYDIAVTNPPYLNKFDPALKKYIKKHYANYSGDLFSVFIYNNINLVKSGGYAAYMTPFVWMFIKTYEKLRHYILSQKEISSLIQMEYSAFEEATVPINTFVLKNISNHELGTYIKLSDFKGGMDVQKQKVLEAIAEPDIHYLYRTNQANFEKIPGSPIAYWASKHLISIFHTQKRVGDYFESPGRLKTHNNKKYLRMWWEIDNYTKWVFIHNGGEYRPFYGNKTYVVDFSENSKRIYNQNGGSIGKYYKNLGVTWNLITSAIPGFRIKDSATPNSSGAPTLVSINNNSDFVYNLLGYLNTKVCQFILNMFNPTLNTNLSNVLSLPFSFRNKSVSITVKNINLSKSDWDAFENSWDFTRHPLLAHIADDKQPIWYYALVPIRKCAKIVPIFADGGIEKW